VLRLLGWLGLPAYALLLAWRAHSPADPDLQSAGTLLALVKDALRQAFWQFVRFVPVGALAVFAMPAREGLGARTLGMALPGLALGVGAACGVLVAAGGKPYAFPGLFTLAIPLLAVAFGVWVGMTLRRGVLATLLFLPKLAVLGAVAAGAGLFFLYTVLGREPLPFEAPEITSADKKRLNAALRGQAGPASPSLDLRLAPRDLDLLLAWGLSIGGHRAKARFDLPDDDVVLEASARVPRIPRYLNLGARAHVRVEEGRLDLSVEEVRVGKLAVPRAILYPAALLLEKGLQDDRRARALLRSIRRLSVEEGTLQVSCDRASLPPGFLARFLYGDAPTTADAAALRAQLANLQATAPRLPADGEGRLRTAVESAFKEAALRTRESDAVRQNRAAVLALGLVLGTPRLEPLTGRVIDPKALFALRRAYRGATLRGRSDWTKHFVVSAALAAAAFEGASDAAGLFKEELDADGGSGFSFGDLLADRAGTVFGQAATASPEKAQALQARMLRGFVAADVFPPADGLPEGIPEAELQDRYGGVGGPEYGRLAAEIERRIAALPVRQP
jgi:hypothetical protein